MSNIAFRKLRVEVTTDSRPNLSAIKLAKGELVQVIKVGKGTIRVKPQKYPNQIADVRVEDLESLSKEENELANLLFG